jgi:spore maturation protein SpmB
LESEVLKTVTNIAGPLVIFSIISSFLCLAFTRKVNVYDTFIEGAKEGFETAIKIIPFLVAMLVGIGVFRAAGGLDLIINAFSFLFNSIGIDSQFVQALPVGLMKPFSGSGARGLMVETMKTNGADSLVSYMACLMNGSHDTTFYIIAVYFGSIAIKNTRYAIATGLLTDLVSIIVSIILAYIFFA